MHTILSTLFYLLILRFRKRVSLELEVIALRHQLVVLRQSAKKRLLPIIPADRFVWSWLYHVYPHSTQWMNIIQRETVVSWHCHGYLYYWRCHSRPKGGRRPYRVTGELRRLMFQLYSENPIWGAGRIHGELQKLGHKVSRSSVHPYLKRYPPRPPPGWRTFLQNHMQNAAPIGFFVVAAMLFKLLHTMTIVGLNYTGILRENIRTRGGEGVRFMAKSHDQEPGAPLWSQVIPRAAKISLFFNASDQSKVVQPE